MSTSTKQRITIFLNPLLAKQARAQAVIEDETLTSYIEKALISFLPQETIIKKPEIKGNKI